MELIGQNLKKDAKKMEEEFNLSEKIEKWIKDHKTSWKYLQRNGYMGAKSDGACIFLYPLGFSAYTVNAIEQLNKIHKEFIKRLKEEDEIDKVEGNPAYHLALKRFKEKIDKLAGEKLI